MLIDANLPLCNLDGQKIMIDQEPDLPEGARVVNVAGMPVVTDRDGNVVLAGREPPVKGGSALTFGKIAVIILQRELKGDDQLSEGKKYDLFDLALKFHKATLPVEISSDEARTLTERAAIALPKETFWPFAQAIKRASAAA